MEPPGRVFQALLSRTWLKDVSFRVWGPRSIIACRGSSTSNMPFTFLSPKYRREASSRPSCHISCQRMATRISSSLTCVTEGGGGKGKQHSECLGEEAAPFLAARGSLQHRCEEEKPSLETCGQATRASETPHWLPTHHHGLLDQGVAVLTHVLQNLVGCVVAGCGCGLRSHSQGVDEGLRQTQRNTCKPV